MPKARQDIERQEEPQPIAKTPPVPSLGPSGIVLQTLDEMKVMAECILSSGFAPKDMTTASKIVVAMQHGFEVGLPMLQAVQSIAVINGRPTMWGDALGGLVQASGKMAWKTQAMTGEGDAMTATFTSFRHGDPEPVISTFSVADAKTAKLWGKDIWAKYPKRMLMNRARAFNLRDNFPDVLRGLSDRQEALDTILVAAESDAPTTGVDGLARRITPPKEPEKPNAEPKKQPDPTPAATPENAGEATVPDTGGTSTMPHELYDEIGSQDRALANHVWNQAVGKYGGPCADAFLEDLKATGESGDEALRVLMAKYGSEE